MKLTLKEFVEQQLINIGRDDAAANLPHSINWIRDAENENAANILELSFSFKHSPQGEKYWKAVCRQLRASDTLQKLPFWHRVKCKILWWLYTEKKFFEKLPF